MLPYRPRRLGPALRAAPLPMMALTVSAVVHIMVLAVLALLAGIWSQWNQSRVYVVNLVPAISSVGSGPARAPSPPPRSEPVAKRSPASEQKETPVPATPKALPPPTAAAAPAPALKEAPVARIKPAMPKDLPPPITAAAPAPMPREPTLLPRSPEPPKHQFRLPVRLGAVPPPAEKGLAPLVSDKEPRPVVPPATREPAPALPRVEPAPAPGPRPVVTSAPLGSPGGSPAGTASLSLDVSDFPFTLYLHQIVRKVSEKWDPRTQAAEAGRRALVLFEIGREGQITNPKIEWSSGNTEYDRAALRAVIDASPFPPLPREFTGRVLRVHLGFEPPTGRG